MDTLDLYYAPMTLLMDRPYLAGVPALVFFVCHRRL